MSGTPLSDWTPIAYFQREEERRRNERKTAGAAPPEQECHDNDEKRLGGVTVASLQRRFLLLEQRLAILEQREHERQVREKLNAASAQAQRGTSAGGAAYLGEEISVRQGEDYSKAKSRPEFTYIKVEQAEPEDARKTGDFPAQSQASDSWRDNSSGAPSDFVEIHPLRGGEPFQAEPARKMAQAFYSFAVTAFLAGSIGFMAAILIVPAEKALKFHALFNIALSAVSEAARTK
ncbi:MAG: hypothetical protein AB7U61_17895 [Methylocystis sp.]